jgi:hypothetical protein
VRRPSVPAWSRAGDANSPQSDMAGFMPLHDCVLVKRIEVQEETPGGIVIPDTAKEKPIEGEVKAVCWGSKFLGFPDMNTRGGFRSEMRLPRSFSLMYMARAPTRTVPIRRSKTREPISRTLAR